VKLLTTGAFDGTGNVSGAVTLLNSAVISKVLTGYASGPGAVEAATDSILAAIQKTGILPFKMDAVTAANYKVGVTAAGANGINFIPHFHHTSSFNRDDL
jgi:hypothetical protein